MLVRTPRRAWRAVRCDCRGAPASDQRTLTSKCQPSRCVSPRPNLLQAAGEPYKLEILETILQRDPEAPITIYHIGEGARRRQPWGSACNLRAAAWSACCRRGMSPQQACCLLRHSFAGNPGSEDHWWDLCAGPHVDATGDIAPDALDLESVAGGVVPTTRASPCGM